MGAELLFLMGLPIFPFFFFIGEIGICEDALGVIV